jgi:hypothetical protein
VFFAEAIKREDHLMTCFTFLAAAGFVACLGGFSAPGLAAETPLQIKPAKVEATASTTLKKVTLTAKAAERVGIQIDEVRLDQSGRRIVPYASVLYDLTGGTWIYVHSDPLSFVREAVKIDVIRGENVYLTDGPPPGTKVLTTGVSQVFGAEVGVGH